jgi:hypothetical protein
LLQLCGVGDIIPVGRRRDQPQRNVRAHALDVARTKYQS